MHKNGSLSSFISFFAWICFLFGAAGAFVLLPESSYRGLHFVDIIPSLIFFGCGLSTGLLFLAISEALTILSESNQSISYISKNVEAALRSNRDFADSQIKNSIRKLEAKGYRLVSTTGSYPDHAWIFKTEAHGVKTVTGVEDLVDFAKSSGPL